MKKQDVIRHFGSVNETAKALRISPAAVSQWDDELSDRIGYKVELATNGAFKTRETLAREAATHG